VLAAGCWLLAAAAATGALLPDSAAAAVFCSTHTRKTQNTPLPPGSFFCGVAGGGGSNPFRWAQRVLPVLCYGLLCFAVLRYAFVLCCTLLCCFVLRCVLTWHDSKRWGSDSKTFVKQQATRIPKNASRVEQRTWIDSDTRLIFWAQAYPARCLVASSPLPSRCPHGTCPVAMGCGDCTP